MLDVTREELKTLPPWSQVAFSARCAQRVSGLFRCYWKDSPEKHIVAVERALSVASQSARDGNRAAAYQASDPEWIMQTLPELLLQQFREPETADAGFVDDEPPFDPSVDALSNKVADQLIEDAPQVISKARLARDKVADDEEVRIQQMVDARIALQQTVQARLKSIGLAVEVTDKDIVRPA